MKNPYLSLVVPAFNEEKIIKESIESILKFLSKKNYSWEVILVDDGSTDKTVRITKTYKRVRVLSLKENMGKGAALRAGVLVARGEYIVFTDADLSVPIHFLDELMGELKDSQVVVGSRRVEGAIIKTHQPFLREMMGRVFTKLTQILIGSSIADFTCGFKGFQAEAGKKLFSLSRINRWAYDSEIIFLAQKLGYKIAQVPVIWENRIDTRVKMGKAAIESLIDVLKIRIWDLGGRYEI
jgi:dolichyl-phosphate beta-glucosyltransferase